jgi:hypothetical protein
MNRIMRDQYPLFREYQRLRGEVLASLTDNDLAFTPGGKNLILGALCREIGEIEQAYINSFKTWRMDWSYRVEDAALEQSTARLGEWYSTLDQELETTISAMSDEELAANVVDRGPHFKVPAPTQLEIYKEALLLFYGKADVYLKLLDKPLSEQWQHWIG